MVGRVTPGFGKAAGGTFQGSASFFQEAKAFSAAGRISSIEMSPARTRAALFGTSQVSASALSASSVAPATTGSDPGMSKRQGAVEKSFFAIAAS